MNGVYGPIVTATEVRKAIEDTIAKWMGDYLYEIGERNGFARGDLPLFNSFEPMIVWDKFAEDQVPMCLIMAPGTLDEPRLHRGKYLVRWGVGIGCVISGQDRKGTWKLGEVYAAAVRTLLLQHPSLGGFAEGVKWINERYDTLPSETSRTLGSGSLQFAVDVYGVAEPGMGPAEPLVDLNVGPGDWPEVDTVTFTVDQRS